MSQARHFILMFFFSFFMHLSPASCHINPLDHTILIYSAEDNDLESHSFVDFAKLTELDLKGSICAHQLLDTKSMGSYQFRICGKEIKTVRLPNQNMSNVFLLKQFIKDAIAATPAKKYSLVLQGHGFSHVLRTEEESSMFVSDIRETLEELGIKMHIISLDMCLMSTLETLYELKDVAEYIIANEDYCPWDGVISPDFLPAFEEEKEGLNLVRRITKAALAQNTALEDPFDITLIQTQALSELVQTVKAFHLKHTDFQDRFLIDPSEKDFEYDLYETVMNLSRLTQDQKNQFKRAFSQAVLFYGANSNKIKKGPTHGISILKTKNYPGFNPSQREAFKRLRYHQK